MPVPPVTTPPYLIIETVFGACPCQGWGSVHGCPWYFRARHGEWTLDVSPIGGDPVWAFDSIVHCEGDDPWDGWMPSWVAAILITTLLAPIVTHITRPDHRLVRVDDEEVRKLLESLRERFPS